MTQFILLHTQYPITSDCCDFEAITSNDTFLAEASDVVFKSRPQSQIWNLKIPIATFDDIFIQARHEIDQGSRFEDTLLFKLVSSLIQPEVSIALWYGSDYRDLKEISDPGRFLHEIKAGLNHPSAECYVKFAG